jgi:hypothetical protein
VPLGSGEQSSVAVRLQNITEELRRVEELLSPEAELAPGILDDFRDAVNRVRNAAWAMRQFAETRAVGRDSNALLALLVAERVRVAFQLCQCIEQDLDDPGIQVQKGPLLHLLEAVRQLARRLKEKTGE